MPIKFVTQEDSGGLQEIADILAKSRKVVVITGAGISTNCGIPDFRSENGLYSLIQAKYDAAAASKPINLEVQDGPPTKRRRLVRSHSLGMPMQPAGPGLRNDAAVHCNEEISKSQDEKSLDRGRKPGRPRKPLPTRKQLPANDDQFNDDIPMTEDGELTTRTASCTSLSNLKGRDLFDSMIWTNSLTTKIFLTFIASLRRQILNDVANTTATHKFLRILRDGGRLVRCYTQNIDGLESREGLCSELTRGPGSRKRFSSRFLREARPAQSEQGEHGDGGCEVVELHGGLNFLRCELCQKLCRWDERQGADLKADDGQCEEESLEKAVLEGNAPNCTRCCQSDADRRGKGRRSLAIGRLRPDIVLYGEEHPAAHLIAPIISHDLSLNPEVLLILGTSLRVHGLKVLVREFSKAVHLRGGKVVFVNQTKPSESAWGEVIDIWVKIDCDEWVTGLKEKRMDIWLPQGSKDHRKPRQIVKDKMNKSGLRRPTVTRDSKDNGTNMTLDIDKTLGHLSGRINTSGDSGSKIVSVLAADEAMIRKDADKAKDDGATIRKDTPLKSGGRRKPAAYRPMAVRDDKTNGVILTEQIFAELRKLPDPSISSSVALTTSPRSLSKLSVNIQNRHPFRWPPLPNQYQIKRQCQSSPPLPCLLNSKDNRAQLPTPATSDEAVEPSQSPSTRRIKMLGSIGTILSSPSAWESRSSLAKFEIWRDVR